MLIVACYGALEAEWLSYHVIEFDKRGSVSMKKFSVALVVAGLLASANAISAIEDTSNVPTTISMVDFCGVLSVNSLDFVNVEADVDAVSNATVSFNVQFECPAGNYEIYFDGTGAFSATAGADITVASTPGGAHLESGAARAWNSDGDSEWITFHATLRDEATAGNTPDTVESWSGSIPLTLISVP